MVEDVVSWLHDPDQEASAGEDDTSVQERFGCGAGVGHGLTGRGGWKNRWSGAALG